MTTVSHAVHVLTSVLQVQFQKAKSILSMQMLVQSAVLALLFVLLRLSACQSNLLTEVKTRRIKSHILLSFRNYEATSFGKPLLCFLYRFHYFFFISTSSLPTKIPLFPFWSLGTLTPSRFFTYLRVLKNVCE